ncbi:MAG: hypothetical protein R2862_00735 [Thermoanaerobaculia bacterium]
MREAASAPRCIAPPLMGLDSVLLACGGEPGSPAGRPQCAFSGAYVGRSHGLAPSLLWGDLFRLAGCDVVVYPNAGGRFLISPRDCREIQEHLLGPMGGMRSSPAMVGGGSTLASRATRGSYWSTRSSSSVAPPIAAVGCGSAPPSLEVALAGTERG